MKTLKTFFEILILLVPFNGIACSCAGNVSLKEEMKKSDMVFSGKVLLIREIQVGDNPKYSDGNHVEFEYLFEIEKVYKGKNRRDTISIISPNPNGECGIDFRLGNRYILFSYKDEIILNSSPKKRLITDTCTRTTIFNTELDKELRKR